MNLESRGTSIFYPVPPKDQLIKEDLHMCVQAQLRSRDHVQPPLPITQGWQAVQLAMCLTHCVLCNIL